MTEDTVVMTEAEATEEEETERTETEEFLTLLYDYHARYAVCHIEFRKSKHTAICGADDLSISVNETSN